MRGASLAYNEGSLNTVNISISISIRALSGEYKSLALLSEDSC